MCKPSLKNTLAPLPIRTKPVLRGEKPHGRRLSLFCFPSVRPRPRPLHPPRRHSSSTPADLHVASWPPASPTTGVVAYRRRLLVTLSGCHVLGRHLLGGVSKASERDVTAPPRPHPRRQSVCSTVGHPPVPVPLSEGLKRPSSTSVGPVTGLRRVCVVARA